VIRVKLVLEISAVFFPPRRVVLPAKLLTITVDMKAITFVNFSNEEF
jgi:hypothetical protein